MSSAVIRTSVRAGCLIAVLVGIAATACVRGHWASDAADASIGASDKRPSERRHRDGSQDRRDGSRDRLLVDGKPPAKEAGSCGAQCSNACAGGSCVIGCTECKSPVICPPGMPCLVVCDGISACGVVDCSAASSCSITCKGIDACSGGVTCGRGNCQVSCDGIDACGPVGCDKSCGCRVECLSGMACSGAVKCPPACAACTAPAVCACP